MSVGYWVLGIVGWPLGYSLSPRMHRAALQAAGLAGEYREYPVEPGALARWLEEVGAARLSGFNVTMPHKRAVWEWIRSRAPRGKLSEALETSGLDAVNTVVVTEGSPVGYNTDGEGFLAPLTEPPRSLSLAGWHAVVLGSGGAAAAIATTLALKTRAVRLTLWNREGNLERARALAKRLNRLRGAEGFAEATSEISALPVEESHLLVNTTPLGMPGKGEVPAELIGRMYRSQLVYDIVYEPRQTSLIRAARERGCPTVTGEEMLAGQAALSFALWTGVREAGGRPIRDIMLDALQKPETF